VRRLDTDLVFAQAPAQRPTEAKQPLAEVRPADLDKPFAQPVKAAKVKDFRFHDLQLPRDQQRQQDAR
jgi:hypothetical protein